jgi:endonuclease/exonuclease/phosphatase (EEP) superfamily protein YafD
VPIAQSIHHSFGGHKGALITRLHGGAVIINAHLIANTDGDWSRANRFYPKHKVQLDQLLAIADHEATRATQLILTGDLNLAKTCDLYEYFVRAGEWTDAFADGTGPTFHGEFLPAGRRPQCIDYLFARGSAPKFTAATQLFPDKITLPNGRITYLSNHLGLYAKLLSIGTMKP